MSIGSSYSALISIVYTLLLYSPLFSCNAFPTSLYYGTTCSDHSLLSMTKFKDKTIEPSSTESSFKLGYVTDVEGNLDYFMKYVDHSQVLAVESIDYDDTRKENIISFTLSLVDGGFFVFGGDAVDKGLGDIRLVTALVDLKHRYPDRVFLLVGNRDLNKLRMTAELSREDMLRPIEQIPPPHWDASAPTLKEFLMNEIQNHQNEEIGEVGKAPPSLDEMNTRVNRLKYILKHTLGCPNTFEFRRMELAILRGSKTSESIVEISDEQVVDSFLDEVRPGGSLFQYMQCANVAVIVGNTLFCHGAVDRNTIRFVPKVTTKFENPTFKSTPAKMADTVEEWIDGLNEFYQQGFKDYQKRPFWNKERTSRGGESLMALQNRPAMWGRSIVSNCYGDGGCITTSHASDHRNDPERLKSEQSNPLVFEKVSSDPKDSDVASWLLNCAGVDGGGGIQRVVVGHKPTGDCPAVLSSVHTGVEIVSADTSFSDTSAEDNRGLAISVVEILGVSSRDNQLHLRGVLRDGTRYNSAFHRLHSKNQIDTHVGDPFVGRQISDGKGWWVKANMENGSYWITRGNGRNVEYRQEEKKVIETLFLDKT